MKPSSINFSFNAFAQALKVFNLSFLLQRLKISLSSFFEYGVLPLIDGNHSNSRSSDLISRNSISSIKGFIAGFEKSFCLSSKGDSKGSSILLIGIAANKGFIKNTFRISKTHLK